jgi:hypothetical protein
MDFPQTFHFSMLFQLHLKIGVHEKNTHLLIAEHESSLKEMESAKISRLLVKAYLLQVQEVIDDVRLCLEDGENRLYLTLFQNDFARNVPMRWLPSFPSPKRWDKFFIRETHPIGCCLAAYLGDFGSI